jgi:hypothetical protein
VEYTANIFKVSLMEPEPNGWRATAMLVAGHDIAISRHKVGFSYLEIFQDGEAKFECTNECPGSIKSKIDKTS